MKKLKLTDIAPYSGKRVQPFDGVKNYLSTGDLKDEGLSFEEVTFKSKPSRADILVSKGDILFAKMVNTNKVLQIDKKLDGTIVSTGFSVHKPDENVLHGNYLIQFLKNNSFLRQKNKLCTGAIQSAISNTGIEKILVPVPDYFDQLHIANLLSKAENLLSQRKESIRLLDEFLKSSFWEMFGTLTSNKKKFPKGKIRDVVTEVKYGTSKPAEEEGKYPYLRMNNITYEGYWNLSKMKFINMDDAEKKKYSVKKGDLLFNRTNSKELVGKTSVFNLEEEMIIAGYLIRVRFNEKANPYFIWGYLNSLHGKQTLLGMCNSIVGMANINAQELQDIKILIPPIELQTQFASIVTKTEALKTQYQQSLQELENLYGSLSQKAFRGELKLKDVQDDLLMAAEPATVYIATQQSSIPENKKGFAKQVLGGKIVSLFKDDKNFTHIKFQKLQYLAEQIAEEDLLWNYYRQAAGPHDNKFKYSVIAKLNENKWFEERNYKFYPLQKAGDVDRYYQTYFGNKSDRLNEIFTLLKNASEKLCEAIATIYAVWNNHIILNQTFDKSKIKTDFFEWSSRKEQQFSEDEFERALDWMQNHQIVPTGFGQLIKEKTDKK